MSEITVPQSLINLIQQHPDEDIIQLCVQDIVNNQIQQGVPENSKKNMLSSNFQAKLASRIMVKSIEQTMLEHPEFFPENWNNLTANNNSSNTFEAIYNLRKNNPSFAKEFSLNVLRNYLLVQESIQKER